MKLCIAIVNDDDAKEVGKALLSAGFPATKLSSVGGFLNMNNATFIIGVDENKVDIVVDVIKQNTSKRMQLITDIKQNPVAESLSNNTVTVGGATIFVVDVDNFIKF